MKHNTTRTNKVKSIRDCDDLPLGPGAVLLNQTFNFYVENKSFIDEEGLYEKTGSFSL